jgi:putative membrane protein
MVARHLIDESGRARIEEAVRAAEAATSVEIRLVLAHASGHYGEYELIYPALLALVAGGALAGARPALAGGWLFIAEATLFALAAALLQWPALRRALVPRPVKHKAAWRQARLNYAGVGLTSPHTHGVLLLYCSAAERYVEILVDDLVAEALPGAVWSPIVDHFKTRFAAGAVADAFVEAAGACAAALGPKFPRRAGDTNELPDRLEEVN